MVGDIEVVGDTVSEGDWVRLDVGDRVEDWVTLEDWEFDGVRDCVAL